MNELKAVDRLETLDTSFGDSHDLNKAAKAAKASQHVSVCQCADEFEFHPPPHPLDAWVFAVLLHEVLDIGLRSHFGLARAIQHRQNTWQGTGERVISVGSASVLNSVVFFFGGLL